MLGIPRPATVADCGEERRPCPWAACRHHLLLEVTEAKRRTDGEIRPTKLRLNGPRWHSPRSGRRSGLASSAAAQLVSLWIEEATEMLSRLEYTCTFDVVRDYPEGIPPSRIAEILGVAAQLVDKEVRAAERAARAAAERDLGEDACGALMVHDPGPGAPTTRSGRK